MTAPGNPLDSSANRGGLVVGGGAIIGVASASEQEGLHEFAEKTHYNAWYFIFDPTTDRGGLISGPYTGKTFGTVGALGAPMGSGGQQQQPAGGFSPPSSFNQPSSMGQPSSFGQPSPPRQNSPTPR